MTANYKVNYFFANAQAGRRTLDLQLSTQLQSAMLGVVGQQATVTGTGQVEAVYAGLGVSVDFSQSGAGADKLYLDGQLSDYRISVAGNVLTLTRTGAVNTSGSPNTITNESVTSTYKLAANADDTIVFANGAITVANAAAKVAEGVTANDLNPAETSLVLPTFEAHGASASRVLLTQPGSVVAAATDPLLVIAGTSGVDKVYVRAGAQVDARALGGATDLIYLTGKWSDYDKAIDVASKSITFTRTVGGQTEKVWVAAGSGMLNDLLIFADGAVKSQVALNGLNGPLDASLTAVGGTLGNGQTTSIETLAVASLDSLSQDSGNATDWITNQTGQTIKGTYIGHLRAGDKIQVRLDSGDWQDATVTTTSVRSGTFELAGVTLTGTHTVQVRTVGLESNWGGYTDPRNTVSGQSKTATLDQGVPEGQLAAHGDTALAKDLWVNNAESQVALKISTEKLKAGDTIQLKKDGQDFGAPHTVTDAEILAGQVVLPINKADLVGTDTTDKAYALTAVFSDTAGNTSTSDPYTLTVDTGVPTVVAASVATTLDDGTTAQPDPLLKDNYLNASEDAVLLKVSSDTATGKTFKAGDVLQVIDNGAVVATYTVKPEDAGKTDFYISVNKADLAKGSNGQPIEGDHVLTIKAVDDAGNTSSVQTTVTVDTQLPSPLLEIAATNTTTAAAQDNVLGRTEDTITLTVKADAQGTAFKAGDVVELVHLTSAVGVTPVTSEVLVQKASGNSPYKVTIQNDGDFATFEVQKSDLGAAEVRLSAHVNDTAGNAADSNALIVRTEFYITNDAMVANQVTALDVTSDIVLVASETLADNAAVAGKYITFTNKNNTHAFSGEAETHTFKVLVTDTRFVTISGDKKHITIKPPVDFDFGNGYNITIDEGAFKSAAGVANVVTASTDGLNFDTVQVGADFADARQGQTLDATAAVQAGKKWFTIDNQGSFYGNSVDLDLSGGNYAMVVKDTSANGASPLINNDGIGVQGNAVNVSNWGAGDLIYVDDQKITVASPTAINDAARVSIMGGQDVTKQDGSATTSVQTVRFDAGSGNSEPGYIHILSTEGNTALTDAALRTQLNVSNTRLGTSVAITRTDVSGDALAYISGNTDLTIEVTPSNGSTLREGDSVVLQFYDDSGVLKTSAAAHVVTADEAGHGKATITLNGLTGLTAGTTYTLVAKYTDKDSAVTTTEPVRDGGLIYKGAPKQPALAFASGQDGTIDSAETHVDVVVSGFDHGDSIALQLDGQTITTASVVSAPQGANTITGGVLKIGEAEFHQGSVTLRVPKTALGDANAHNLTVHASNVVNLTSDSTALTVQAPEYVALSGVAGFGPVLTGNDLTVTAYDQNGQVLATDTTVEDTGAFTLQILKTHRGPVLITVTSRGANADYVDENTKASTNLGNADNSTPYTVRAVVNADGSARTVNITPLTDLAAQKLLGSNAKLQPNISTGAVTAVNTGVAQKFLGQNSDVTTLDFTPTVKADGTDNTAAADLYGQVLKQLSDLSAAQGGNLGAAQAALAAKIAWTPGQAASDLTLAPQAASTALLAKVAFNADNTAAAAQAAPLAAQDLVDLGLSAMSGLTPARQQAVLDAIKADTSTNMADVAALKTLVDRVAALGKIQDYADGTSAAAPQLSDYVAAAKPGSTDVTAENLAAVNAKVLASDAVGTASADKVQALVAAGVNAHADALSKIEAYAANGTTAPTVDDYRDAGIQGVNADNLSAVNHRADQATAAQAHTVADIQALATAGANAQVQAFRTLRNYALDAEANDPPTAEHLRDIGIKGSITPEALNNAKALLQVVADASVNTPATMAERLQTQFDAVQKLNGWAQNSTDPAKSPSVQDYLDAGITGVTDAKLSTVNAQLAAQNSVSDIAAVQNITLATQTVQITNITDDAGAVKGSVAAEGITNDLSPHLEGTLNSALDAGQQIIILRDGVQVGTATVNGTRWTFDDLISPAPRAADGQRYSYTARVSDAKGNTGPLSDAYAITVDAQAPVLSTDLSSYFVTDISTQQNKGALLEGQAAPANGKVTITFTNHDPIVVDANALGAWSVTLPADIAANTQFTLQFTDAAGESSAVSAPRALQVSNTVAPPILGTLAAPVLKSGQDTGLDNTDGITRLSTPTIAGRGAQANATIHIAVQGSEVGTATANSLGDWSYTFTGAQLTANSLQAITVKQSASGATTSPASQALELRVDTAMPAAPTLDTITVINGQVSEDRIPGAQTGQKVSKDTLPTLSGSAQASAQVEVFIDGRSVGTTLANSEGKWTFTPAQALATGVRQIHVKQTSLAGNTSPESALSYLRLDTTVAKPTFTMNNDSGSLISGSTIDTTPTFKGSNAEAFATIEVFVGGQSIGTTTANAVGAWSFTPSKPLAAGSQTIVVSQTDLAGNTSDTTTPDVLVQSLSTSFTGGVLVQIAAPVVLAVPSAPTLAQASNTGSTADTLTSVLKPTLTGTIANPSVGMTVSIFDQASITVTGTTSANGVYQKLSASQQAGLVFSDAFTPAGGSTVLDTSKAVYKATLGGVDWYIWARQGSGYHLSQSGNTSEWYFEGSLDGSFASTPTGITAWAKTSITATEVQNGGLVTPVSAMALSDTLLGSASVNATTGAWTFTPTNNLSASEHPLVVQVRDSQGNTSERSSALPLVIDTAPPAAIAAPVLSDISNSGSKLDTITSDALPTLSGRGAAHGATVQILRNGAVIGTTPASNTGAWTFTPTTQLAEGTSNITARQLSATGVASADSPALSLTIDTTPAATPGFTALTGSQSPRPIYSGTAEAGASVELTFVSPSNVTTTYTVTASANGSWTYQPTDPQEAGNWQVSARQQDVAGTGFSAPTLAQTVTIDQALALPAAAPALALATDSNTGSQADAITSVTTPTFNITGIDSTATAVQVSVDGGAYANVSGFATGNTTLSYTPVSPLSASAAGTAHTIAVRQVVGGVSSAVSTAGITVDNAAIWSEVSSTATLSNATAARYIRIYHSPSANTTLLGLTGLKVFTADGTDVAAGRPATVGAVGGSGAFWSAKSNPNALTDGSVGGDFNNQLDLASNAVLVDVVGSTACYIDLDLGNVYDVSWLTFWGINTDWNASNNLRVFLSTTALGANAAADLMTQQSVSNFDISWTDKTFNGAGSSVSASAMNKQAQLYLKTSAPELTGVSEAGATIEISENGGVLTTVTVGASGTWKATLPPTTAGSHTYSIKTTDLAGLSVTKTGAFYAVPDLTGVQPSTPVLAPASDSGTQGDGTTNITLPTLTGTGSLANTQVELLNASGTVLGRGLSNSLGAWTITLTQPLTEGLNQVKARYSHALGTGPASDNALAITLDTTPDSFALGASLALKAGNDTGTSSVDGITQITQPWFKGTGAKAGASVQVQFTATGQTPQTVTVIAASDGSFEAQPSGPLANATWTASATFADAANNRATPLVATFTVDNVPPINPSISTSGTVGQSPTISGGGATAGETIKLFDNSTNVLLGQAVADSLGNWSTQLLGLTTGGQYTLRAERQDTAGNIASATQTITLAPEQAAAVPPGAVTQLVLDTANATPEDSSASTVLTQLTQPVIKGLADPGVTVNIYNGTTLVGTGSADSSTGAFAIRLNTPVATDGLKTLQVQAVSAGLTGPMSSVQYTLDSAAPAAPTALGLATVSDTGVLGDNITSVRKPVLKGTAEAGSIVNVSLDSVLLGTATADSRGNWTYDTSTTLAGDLSVGNHVLSATAKDAAGNTGNAGTYTFSVPSVPTPAAPAITLASGSDTGVVGDLRTQLTTPGLSITGIDSAATQVEVQVDGGSWTAVSGFIPGNTSATYTPSALTGSAAGIGHTVAVRQTVNGVTSNASANTSLVVDNGNSAAIVNNLAVKLASGSYLKSTGVGISNGFTVEGWFKLDAVNVNNNVFSLANSPDTGKSFRFLVTNAGATRLNYFNDGASALAQDLSSSSAVAAGTWTHLAFSVSDSGVVTCYINGTATGNSMTLPNYASNVSGANSWDLYIGAGSSTNSPFTANPNMAGSVKEVQVWDSVKTSVEVGTDRTTAYTGSESNLAFYMPGKDAAGSTALADLKTNSSKVTLSGTVTPGTVDNTAYAGPSTMAVLQGPVTLTGTATAGETITVKEGGNTLDSWVVVSSGTWSKTLHGVGAGTHTYTCETSDAAGNTASTTKVVTVNARTDMPVIVGLSTATDSGLQGDFRTNNTLPTLTGTGLNVGDTITLKVGSNTVGTTTVNSDKTWSANLTQALTAGANTVTVTETNGSAVQQGSVGSQRVQVDNTNTALSYGVRYVMIRRTSDTDSATMHFSELQVMSNGVNVALNKTVTAGNTVNTSAWGSTEAKLVDGVGASADNVFVNYDGVKNWVMVDLGQSYPIDSITLIGRTGQTALANGVTILLSNSPLTGTANIAGLKSAATSFVDITTTADSYTYTPAQLGLPRMLCSGETLTGSTEANATVTFYLDNETSTPLGSVKADAAGAWSFVLSADTKRSWSDGIHKLKMVSTDVAGNQVRSEYAFNFDQIPVLTINAPNGTQGATSFLSGTGDAGNTITLRDSAGTVLTTTTVNRDGQWRAQVTNLQTGSPVLTVTATDASSNTNTLTQALTVDATLLTRPQLSLGADTGQQGDGITTWLRPTLMGSGAAAGAVVQVVEDIAGVLQVLGSTTADANGYWSLNVASALSEGAHALQVQQLGANGAVARTSAPSTITIDRNLPQTLPVVIGLSADTDTGMRDNDGITQSTVVTVKGTVPGGVPAGGKVYVSIDNATGQLATMLSDGSWAYTTNALSAGAHTASATVADSAGNESFVSARYNFTVDTSASAPMATVLAGTGGTTQPVLSGTAEAGATVTVRNGGAAVGTAVADDAGNWRLVINNSSTVLAANTYTLTLTQTDKAGNTSSAGSVAGVVVGTTASTLDAYDQLGALTLSVGQDTGVSSTDGITQRNQLTVEGTGAMAGATVNVYSGTTLVGTTTASGSGTWSLTTSRLSDGLQSLTARQVKADGLALGLASAATNVTVDTFVSPGLPSVVGLRTVDGVSYTGTAKPALTGSNAEAGATVTLFDGEQQLAQATVNSNGTWSITPLTPLAQGVHSLSVRMSDLAGNVSVKSPAIALTVDTQVSTLPAPRLLASSDSGRSNSDGITQVQTLRVGGTGGESGATVTVFNGTTSVGSTTVAADGSWALTTSSLPAGSYQLYARQVDAAGNTSPLSNALAVQVVTSAPALAAPTWLAADDTGTLGDGVTSTGLARLAGSGAQSGATIDVYNGGVWVGQTTASEAGAWTFTPTQSWGTGVSSITVRQTDAAGNVSAASPVSSLSVVAAPGVLAAPEVALVDLSASAGFAGQIAHSLTPTVKGTGAVAGARVEVFNGTSSLGTTTALADGTWSLALPAQTQGATLQLSVAQSVRGIASATSAARAVKIDTAAVANTAITLDASSDSGVSSTDRITNDARPTLKGQVLANSTVTIQDGDAVLGQALADSTGAWSFRLSQDLTGVHSFTAKVGNDVSQPLVVTIDKQAASAPSAPTLAAVSDTGKWANDAITHKNEVVLQGAGVEAGAQIEVRDAGLLVGKAYADAQGQWQLTTTALGAGTHQLVARQIDAAGNSSDDSQALSVTVKAAPAAPVVTGLVSSSDTGVKGDNTTNLGSFTLQGSGAEAGASVSVWRGNVLLGQGTATATGQWQVSTTQPLVDGSHSLTVRQTDVAGNLSVASSAYTLTVDSTMAAPTLGLQNTATNDTGVLGDGRTQNSKPVISGTAEAGATVQLRRDTGGSSTELLATVVADNTGAWSWQFGTDLTPGTYKLLAQQTDVAGNASDLSKTFIMTITARVNMDLTSLAGGADYSTLMMQDVNADGLVDIITNEVYYQQANGNFVAGTSNLWSTMKDAPSDYFLPGITGVWVDLNNDGQSELIMPTNRIAYIGNDGVVSGFNTTLYESFGGGTIGSIAWADVSGNGRGSLVSSGRIRVQMAGNKFVTSLQGPSWYGMVNLVDLNQDGYLDVLFANFAQMGSGSGAFTSVNLPSAWGDYVSRNGLIDFNNDGVWDVLSTDGLYKGLGNNVYGKVLSSIPTGSATPALIADFNGDGKEDILSSNGQISVWLNQDGLFTQKATDFVFEQDNMALQLFKSQTLQAMDLNGDRSIDVAYQLTTGQTMVKLNPTVIAENTYLRVNVANAAGNTALAEGATVQLYDHDTGAFVAMRLVGNHTVSSYMSASGTPYAEFFGLDPAKTYDVVVRYPGNDQGVTVLTGKRGLGVTGIASGALREVVDSQLTAVSPAGKDVITVAREDRSTASDGGLWTGTRYADSMVGDRGDDTFTPNGANAGEAGDTVNLSNGGHDKVVFNTVLNLNTPTTIQSFTLGAATVADSDAINVSGLLTALGYSGARDAASVASVLRVQAQGTDLLLQANKAGTAGWQDLAVVKGSGGADLSTVTLSDLIGQGNLQLGQLKLSGSSNITLGENVAQSSPTVLFGNVQLATDGGAYTQDMTHASLKVSLGDMYAEDRFSLASGSNGVSVSGSDVAFNGVVIGTIHSSLNGQGKALEVDFAFSGSTLSVADRAAAVQAVAQSVQYQNTGSTPPDYYRDLELEVSDGQTKASLTGTLTVTPVADFESVGGVLMRTGTNAVGTLTGDSRDETFVSYGGPVANAGLSTATGDTLTGGGGRDTFVYRKGNVGQDTITDFGVRGVTGVTAANEDVINLSNLLQGYTEGVSNVRDFVWMSGDTTKAMLHVDYNGKADGSAFQPYMMINLTGVTLSATGAPSFADLLTTLKSNGQLVLG